MTTVAEALRDPSIGLNFVTEIGAVRLSDGATTTVYVTLKGRGFTTGPSDTPANTIVWPWLLDPGGMNQELSLDQGFSGIVPSRSKQVVISREIGTVHDWISLGLLSWSFAGQTITTRAIVDGEPYTSANWVTLGSSTIKKEPDSTGSQIVFELDSPLDQLNVFMARNYHVGIETCVELSNSSNFATSAYNGTYDLDRFTIMARWRVNTAPDAALDLLRKYSSSTSNNFQVVILTAGTMRLLMSVSAASNQITSAASVCDGDWHWMGWSYDTRSLWLIDGVEEDERAAFGTPDKPAVALQALRGSPTNTTTCQGMDLRIYDYAMTADQMRAASRRIALSGDLGNIGSWRCDDNTGNDCADYSSTSDDLISGGTTDWDPSEMGNEGLAGRPMIVSLGQVFNAKAEVISEKHYQYRIHDGYTTYNPHSSGLSLKSRGVAATGSWGNNNTVFTRTGGLADEPTTFNVTGYHPTITTLIEIWQILDEVLVDRGPLAVSSDLEQSYFRSIAGESFAGFVSYEDEACAQIAEALLRSIGGALYLDLGGLMRTGTLIPPVALSPFGNPCVDCRGHGDITYGDVLDQTGSHSVCAWVKMAGLDYNSANIVEKDGYILSVRAGGAVQGANPGVTPLNTTSAAGVVSEEAWHFIAMTYSSSSARRRVYAAPVGGTLLMVAEDTSLTGTPNTGTAAFTVGDDTACGVCEWAVFNAEKTLAQLQAVMDDGYSGASSLVDWSHVSAGSGSDTTEIAATTGTLNNDATWVPHEDIDLDTAEGVSGFSIRRLIPAGQVVTKWRKNWHRMSGGDRTGGTDEMGDIALSVSDSDFWDLQRPHRTHTLPLAPISAKKRNVEIGDRMAAGIATIDDQDVQFASERMARRFGENTMMARITLQRRGLLLDMLDELTLRSASGDHWGGSKDALTFRAVGRSPNYSRESATFTLVTWDWEA
jgi:hypothetical protein